MTSDYLDYENNLAFPPRHDKTALELKRENKRLKEKVNYEGIKSAEFEMKAYDLEQENKKLKSDLHNVLSVLLKVSPSHEGYVRANFPNYKRS